MDRRQFLQSASVVAAAAGSASAAAAQSGSSAPAAAAANAPREPQMRRWTEQRWILDNLIKANGVDWDQPRTVYWNVPCGFEALADFAQIRQRVQKYADIIPAFEAVAKRREAKARDAEAAQSLITARENWFIAAIFYGACQWPIDENSEQNLGFNKKKRDAYANYVKLADHRIEQVSIPFQGKALPAWFHLPPGYSGGRIPAVMSITGMDSFKEASVAMYGDRWLQRGIAVLAFEGPGQWECPIMGIYMTVPGWQETAKVVFDWMAARPELDPERIGITGTSFGSFAGTIVAAAEPRYRACVVSGTALEPGWTTVFQEASPTFKKRFMYMANYIDEAEFDRFRQSLTWEGHAEKIRMPYLCIGGEADELSPIENAERLIRVIPGPKRLVVYQDSRHSVGGVPAAALGPAPTVLAADWMAASLAGQSFPSEHWFVDATGRVNKTPL